MLPLQKFMTAALPESKSGEKPESQSSHNPFPDPVVHIVGFEDTVSLESTNPSLTQASFVNL